MPTPWRLFYDSDCAFCTKWMRRSLRWAELRGVSMETQPLTGGEAMAKGYGDVVVLEADRVYCAGDAWRKLVSLAPWYLRSFSLMRLSPPSRRLVGWIYGLVASRRSCEIGSR